MPVFKLVVLTGISRNSPTLRLSHANTLRLVSRSTLGDNPYSNTGLSCSRRTSPHISMICHSEYFNDYGFEQQPCQVESRSLTGSIVSYAGHSLSLFP